MAYAVACAGVERANLRYIWLINSLEQCFSKCFRKRCQGLRETKMPNGGKVLLAASVCVYELNIRAASFDINHSVTASTQSFAASIKKFPGSVIKSFSPARHDPTFRLSISLRLAVDLLHAVYIKDKCWYLISYLT